MTAPPAPPQDTPEVWMAALARVTARVTADADREDVVSALASGLVEEFGVALAGIWLYNPADDALHLRAHAGAVDAPVRMRVRMPIGELNDPFAAALAQRQMLALDLHDPASPFGRSNWMLQRGLRAYAGFPLLVGDRLCGAMVMFHLAPWPPLMLQALQVLGRQAALALEHARLTDESHSLQVVAADLASARNTNALLEGIVARSMIVLGAEAGAVWLYDEVTGMLTPGATRGLSEQFLSGLASSGGVSTASAFRELQRTAKPWFSRDAAADARARGGALAGLLAREGIVSALRLPLFQPGGGVIGMLALYHRRERLYSEGEIRLAQAFTDQIAVALHNLRLAENEQAAREAAARQLERVTALAQLTEQLLGASDPDAMLRVVAEAAVRLCRAKASVVALIDEGRRCLTPAVMHGEMRAWFATFGERVLDADYLAETATGRAITSGDPVLVSDWAALPITRGDQQMQARDAGVRSLIVAPLRKAGESYGVLWVADTEPAVFTAEDTALVQALAGQAALAVEQARLVRRDQDAAVLEERQRLARDLHDSVTQSVFSLGMLTRAAQAQHARGAPALGKTLDRIGALAQEALAEMRALLFELRPAALAGDGLAMALDKLVASFRVRMDADVTFIAADGPAARALPDAETAIFRIAQEALSNAAKHARAKQVRVLLEAGGARITVTVEDNGVGFDPGAPIPVDGLSGGLGMRTMRERAAAAGLTLRITSAPAAGTRVSVEAPVADGERGPETADKRE